MTLTSHTGNESLVQDTIQTVTQSTKPGWPAPLSPEMVEEYRKVTGKEPPDATQPFVSPGIISGIGQ
jgi:hypothetical protein